jgi:hypothetical protein
VFRDLGFRSLLSLVWNYALKAGGNLAVVVLVFAVLERVQFKGKSKTTEWDPKSLEAVNDPDRISTAGRVARVYAIFALLVIFAFLQQWFGVIAFVGATPVPIPFRVLGLDIPGLALQLWWMAAIVLNVVLLRRGRWTRKTRLAEFALGICGFAIVFYTLSHSATPEFTPECVAQHWPAIEPAAIAGFLMLVKILAHIAYAVFGITLVVSLFDSGTRAYRLVMRYLHGIEDRNGAVRSSGYPV